MNERISFIFVRIKLAERFPSPSPYPRSAIIRHNANEIQCYRSVNLIDREDSAINSFFFPPTLFLFPFFPPHPLSFSPSSFRSRSGYPRISSSSSGKYARGGGGERRCLDRTFDTRRRAPVIQARRQFLARGLRLIFEPVRRLHCELYLLPLRPIPSLSSPAPSPSPPRHALPRRARGTESPLFCRFNVAYCRISPRMPSFPVPFPPPPPPPLSLFTQSSHLSIRDITITPTSYQLLSSPIPSISIVSKELTSPLRFAFFFFFFFYSIEKRKLAELSVPFRFPSSIFVRISVVYEIG